ncbi:MAG: tetratricopeptide repeat protein [Sphingomicrobium sp.]
MAQPPDITETFVREVDENLRRDRLRDFARKNGGWLIAAVILFLGASGGWIYWQHRQLQQSERQVEQLGQIYKDIAAGNLSTAPQRLDALGKSGRKAVRASALFTRAALAIEQNDQKLAISTFAAIAGDGGLPKPYRDLALIRQTALEFDHLKPEAVIARLQPLSKPGNPWFGSAGEMTAVALIKQGKKREAGQLYAAIARDGTVPETIRARAVQIASSLGVDATGGQPLPAQ